MIDKENQGIDILIPFHSQYKLVRELIGNIILHTRKIPYRITVIDDASPNEAFFLSLAQHSYIDGIRLETQSGLGAALNKGISLTKKAWIAILNSDCIVDEMHWLSDLHQSFKTLMKTQKIGMVSARSDNPPGTNPLLKAPKTTRVKEEDQISETAIPLFCCIAPRVLFDKVGPFKEYPYGWYEDEEFYWRMKKFGYKQGVSGKSWVGHVGGATVNELWKEKPDTKLIMENNRAKCVEDLKKLFGKK